MEPDDIGTNLLQRFGSPEAFKAYPGFQDVDTTRLEANNLGEHAFTGDEAVNLYVKHIADLYRKRRKEAGVEDEDQAAKFEAALRGRARNYLLDRLANRYQDDIGNGRMTREYIGERLPVMQSAMNAAGAKAMEVRAGQFEKNEASPVAYLDVARQIALQRAAQRRQQQEGVGGQAFDIGSALPATVGEFYLGSVAAPVAAPAWGVGRAGLTGLAMRGAGGALSTVASQMPLAPARIAAGAGPTPALDDNGPTFEGKPLWKAALEDTATQVIFGATGARDYTKPIKEGTLRAWRNGVLNVFGSSEAVADVNAIIDKYPEVFSNPDAVAQRGGPAMQMVAAMASGDPQRRTQAFQNLAAHGIAFAAFEAAMKTAQRRGSAQPREADVEKALATTLDKQVQAEIQATPEPTQEAPQAPPAPEAPIQPSTPERTPPEASQVAPEARQEARQESLKRRLENKRRMLLAQENPQEKPATKPDVALPAEQAVSKAGPGPATAAQMAGLATVYYPSLETKIATIAEQLHGKPAEDVRKALMQLRGAAGEYVDLADLHALADAISINGNVVSEQIRKNIERRDYNATPEGKAEAERARAPAVREALVRTVEEERANLNNVPTHTTIRGVTGEKTVPRTAEAIRKEREYRAKRVEEAETALREHDARYTPAAEPAPAPVMPPAQRATRERFADLSRRLEENSAELEKAREEGRNPELHDIDPQESRQLLGDLGKEAGLTDQEAHVISERIRGRTLADVGKDEHVHGETLSRERIRQIEEAAVKKLAPDVYERMRRKGQKPSIQQLIHEWTKAGEQERMREQAGTAERGEVSSQGGRPSEEGRPDIAAASKYEGKIRKELQKLRKKLERSGASGAEIERQLQDKINELKEKYGVKQASHADESGAGVRSGVPAAQEGEGAARPAANAPEEAASPEGPAAAQAAGERPSAARGAEPGKPAKAAVAPADELNGTLPDGRAVAFAERADKRRGHRNERVVMVDARALDAAWKRDADNYIPPGGGGTEIPSNTQRFRDFLFKGEPIQAARIHVSPDGRVTIEDGRHRFAVLRDMGIDKMAVAVNPAQAERFAPLLARPAAAPAAARRKRIQSAKSPERLAGEERLRQFGFEDADFKEMSDKDVADDVRARIGHESPATAQRGAYRAGLSPRELADTLAENASKAASGGIDLGVVHSELAGLGYSVAEINKAIHTARATSGGKLKLVPIGDGRDFTQEEHARLPIEIGFGNRYGYLVQTEASPTVYRTRRPKPAGGAAQAAPAAEPPGAERVVPPELHDMLVRMAASGNPYPLKAVAEELAGTKQQQGYLSKEQIKDAIAAAKEEAKGLPKGKTWANINVSTKRDQAKGIEFREGLRSELSRIFEEHARKQEAENGWQRGLFGQRVWAPEEPSGRQGQMFETKDVEKARKDLPGQGQMFGEAHEPEGIKPGSFDVVNIEREATQMLADRLNSNQPQRGITAAAASQPSTAPPALRDQLVDSGRRMVHGIIDNVKELGGKMGPRTSRLSEKAGDAMARFNASDIYARQVVPHLLDEVLGTNARPNDALIVGGVLVESRLRYMREQFIRESQAALNDMYKAQRAGDVKAMNEYREKAVEWRQKANNVESIVGKPLTPGGDPMATPFLSEQDYQQYANDPQVKAAIERYRQKVVPIMERNFRAAEGLGELDPIAERTQIPGLPVNFRTLEEGDAIGPGMVGTGGSKKGEMTNPAQRKLGFAREALGTGHKDIDLASIIENSMRSIPLAAKAEMYRTLVSEGLAKWGEPGQKVEIRGQAAKELKEVRPPKGTQEAEQGERSLYLEPTVYDEVRKALQVDAPAKRWWFTNLVTKATLLSTVEAAYHGKNLATFGFKPGVSPIDIAKNAYKVVTGDPGLSERYVDLARIGAYKEHGLETGMLWGGKTDPSTWAAKFLHAMDHTMRLTADDAFARLKRQGRVSGNEANRRDFINQLGQYNARAQHDVIKYLRETGIGPFATAGSNYAMEGVKALTMSPGVKATSVAHAIGLRAEMLARIGSVFGAVALANFFRWGRVDGDDNTPVGALKLGESKDEKGRTRTSYLDLGSLTGLTRGARMLGLKALAEGTREGAQRKGTDSADIKERAFKDFLGSVLHPAEGPVVSTVHTIATGENTMGRRVAPKGEQGPHFWTALMEANPIIAALSAHGDSGNPSWTERAAKLLGPYGPKESSGPPGRPHRTITVPANGRRR